ncbi:hypothetical protein K3G63_04685 [Hymenobacter sp. HSC-4F20]|uniref:hypothetical protein n=1 Tax=Hymenobacter sp. HSC-4F20 TaxID=2864135 RepID=UPI001C73CA37|nr:hypothetical protein [Hymenobacter sp. HSC-4F20]MBX0289720.1 hypothetical protein [Hymenobacter sp. HSC-4F20]
MNYDRFTQLALNQIAEKGRDITLLNKQLGAYDPLTNTMTDATDTTRTVRAVFTSYKAKDIDGTVIKQGDKRCLIADAVDGKEIIVDGADQYAIVNVEAVQPGDTLILSKVQVRR